MSATYVTATELKANLGIGTLYSDSIVEEVCQTAEDLVNSYLWFNSYPVVGACIYNNLATVVLSAPSDFVVGQVVTLSGSGSVYNGSQTITSTYPYSVGSSTLPYFVTFPFTATTFPKGYSLIQFSLTHADDPYHLIVPYGKCAGVDYKDTTYATTGAVREAAMMLAVDIWQARQQSSAGGVSPDFSPSPYRMGNTLIARVRGLLAPYMSPRSMVG